MSHVLPLEIAPVGVRLLIGAVVAVDLGAFAWTLSRSARALDTIEGERDLLSGADGAVLVVLGVYVACSLLWLATEAGAAVAWPSFHGGTVIGVAGVLVGTLLAGGYLTGDGSPERGRKARDRTTPDQSTPARSTPSRRARHDVVFGYGVRGLGLVFVGVSVATLAVTLRYGPLLG